MAIRIVVLDDGKTWTPEGKIITLTNDGFDRLQDGESLSALADEIMDETLITNTSIHEEIEGRVCECFYCSTDPASEVADG